MKVYLVTNDHCLLDDGGYCEKHIQILGIAASMEAVNRIIEKDLNKEFVKYSKYWDFFDSFKVKMLDDYGIQKFEVET